MDTITADGSHARTVEVALAGRSYPIHIADGLLAEAGAAIAPKLRRPSVVIVSDETVAGLHLETLRASLDGHGIANRTIVVPPGEATKCFDWLERICADLLGHGIERSDVIVALGGGVIGDLAGFAAAVVLRGIDFVQIPTTLLAQVDSSVGGKTGINTAHGKNLVGAFHQPVLVLADTSLLGTLGEREIRAGYAEVAKYGLIDDPSFFDWLEDAWCAIFAGDPAARIRAVETSCRAKAAVVADDEREHGRRALLNLGHTFGHAFEAAAGFSQRLLHGEAVALGMAMAFRFSADLGLCPAADGERVAAHFHACGLPARVGDIGNDIPDTDGLLALMARDKKTAGGRLTFILARGIGEAFVARDVATDDLRAFLDRELAGR
jgi:3-dehydroquinate synthase